jgi:hypothetical protein
LRRWVRWLLLLEGLLGLILHEHWRFHVLRSRLAFTEGLFLLLLIKTVSRLLRFCKIHCRIPEFLLRRGLGGEILLDWARLRGLGLAVELLPCFSAALQRVFCVFALGDCLGCRFFPLFEDVLGFLQGILKRIFLLFARFGGASGGGSFRLHLHRPLLDHRKPGLLFRLL